MSDIEALRQRLGLTAAPLVNAGLAATEHFFRTVLTADALEWWEYLRGIDFHKPVQVKWLEPRTPLVRYDNPVRREIKKITPFMYFTEPGVSPFQTGTSWPTWDYRLYNVVVRTPALVSTASSISFDPA